MKKIIFVLAMISIFVIAGCNNASDGSETVGQVDMEAEGSSLGECLTNKGMKMYGADWCPHCKAQKERFGDDFVNVDYIECEREKAKCDDAGITGYPTWILDGTKYPGNRPLSDLATIAGC